MTKNDSGYVDELSPEDVETIRAMSKNFSHGHIARKFNIDVGHVNFIANRVKRHSGTLNELGLGESNAKKI